MISIFPAFFSRLRLQPQHRVFIAFFLYALGLGGFFPRVGDIQRAMGVAEGALGLALIGTATGTLVSLSVAGRVLERIGHKTALIVLIPLIALFFAGASWARSPWALFLSLFPAGLCIGAVEVAVNVEADRVEHWLERRIMNRAHAFWSIGFFAAGGIGAVLSQLGVSAQWHLAAMVPLLAVAAWLLLSGFEAAPKRAGNEEIDVQSFARPTFGIMALVAFTLSAMLLEGAVADWSAIYMRDVFRAPPLMAGAAVTVGALAQAGVRFFADPFVERYGSMPVARILLAVLGVGTVMVFVAPAGSVALLGFALGGAGTSVIFPLAMSAAAQRTDRPAAVNVAALAQTSFVAYLVGPPLLGFVAQHVGIRWTFGICLPLVALSLMAVNALAAPRQAPQWLGEQP